MAEEEQMMNETTETIVKEEKEEQIMNETAETIAKEEDETQIFKKQIWLGYVDTRVLGRYYGMLTYDYERRHCLFAVVFVFILLGAFATAVYSILSGELATEAPNFHVWLPPLLMLVVTGTFIWSYFENWSRKSTLCFVMYDRCSRLEFDWRTLWFDVKNAEKPSADYYSRHRKLTGKLHNITLKAPEYGIYNKRLYKECKDEEYEHVKSEFSQEQEWMYNRV